jgi:hypothetical protein
MWQELRSAFARCACYGETAFAGDSLLGQAEGLA